MRPVVQSAVFVFLLTGLWWMVFIGAAQAGPYDQGANWLIGLIVGALGGAGGVHVAQRIKEANVPNGTVHPPVVLPQTASSIAEPKPATEPVDVYKVWYATNRAREGQSFTSELTDRLLFGDCRVEIPKSHKFGSLGSNPLLGRILRVNSDGALSIAQTSCWSLEIGPKAFVNSVRTALGKTCNQILVYVHGYNISFENAILRAAQIGFDLKVPVTTAFCWASKGCLESYPADEDTIRLSAHHLADFLSLLHANFPKHRINIIAHSMGNRALMDVLSNIESYPGLAGAKFGQIVLAAPDIDVRLFRKFAAAYPRLSARTTLYVCSKDRALQVSGREHENVRTGYCPPITVVKGIDTIEATNVNLDMLGHGYYAEAASVLYDIAMLLQTGSPPSKRPALLRTKCDDGAAYWTFRAAKA